MIYVGFGLNFIMFLMFALQEHFYASLISAVSAILCLILIVYFKLFDKMTNLKKQNTPKQESGVVYMNYIPVIIPAGKDRPSKKEHDDFIQRYNNDHEYCPKCGSNKYSITYVGYILNLDDKESYKDLNRCICSDCGDRHTKHDRLKSI